MKLRPYRNPENVDESRVPDGWRFLYADEFSTLWFQDRPCRRWIPWWHEFSKDNSHGNQSYKTYIVPVNA